MAQISPLLPPTQSTDVNQNFDVWEKYSRRSYSFLKVVKELSEHPPKLTHLEAALDAELRALNRGHSLDATLIPPQVLNRDLTVGSSPSSVQASVGKEIQPFLRSKSVCARLGGTLLSDLGTGSWSLPRQNATAGASWQTEIATAPITDSGMDSIVLTPSRITAQSVISRQLLRQAQPDIEQFVIDDLTTSIASEVDKAVLNGSGNPPEPRGILALPVNPASTYNYNARSPNVAFGGAASWLSILKFEDTLENAQVHNFDETFGWVASNDVRLKWMGVPQVATFPRYLWEQGDDPFFGRIAGRKAVATSELPTGKIIFGRWSDAIIGTWQAVELLVDPYIRAIQSEVLISLTMWIAVGFRYSSAFVTSSDSATQ
jgi:hypothetical protein